jgi:hypothetical protein
VAVAIPDEQAGGGLGEFGEHAQLVGVGRSQREASVTPGQQTLACTLKP